MRIAGRSPLRARRRAVLAACAAPPPAALAPPPPPPRAEERRRAAAPTPTARSAASPSRTGRQPHARPGGDRHARSRTRRTAPTQPATLSAAEIEALFGDALAAQPRAAAALPPLLRAGFDGADRRVPGRDSRRSSPRSASAPPSRRASSATPTPPATRRRTSSSRWPRAKAVGALLAAEGIDAASLEITSHGEANPLVPTGDNVSEPRNRRVEVTVR